MCSIHTKGSLRIFDLDSWPEDNTIYSYLKWSSIIEEVKKCILVCNNCHGEVESGLVNTDEQLLYEIQSKISYPEEELASKIWKVPSIIIAKEYGVSDNSIVNSWLLD